MLCFQQINYAETLYPGSAPIRFNLLNTKPFGIVSEGLFFFFVYLYLLN